MQKDVPIAVLNLASWAWKTGKVGLQTEAVAALVAWGSPSGVINVGCKQAVLLKQAHDTSQVGFTHGRTLPPFLRPSSTLAGYLACSQRRQ